MIDDTASIDVTETKTTSPNSFSIITTDKPAITESTVLIPVIKKHPSNLQWILNWLA